MILQLNWQLNGGTGWGICGVELAKAFLRAGHRVQLGQPPKGDGLAPWDVQILRPLLTQPRETPDVVFHAFGNDLQPEPPEGAVGLVFLEDTHISPEGVARGKKCRSLVAGSSWCRDVLQSHGLAAGVFVQGVDHALFCPGPSPNVLEGRHPVVFSGGKLEYRKGQDIVVAAFREFLRSEPDAILLTAWHNAWPHTVAGIDAAGHVTGLPKSTAPLDLTIWLAANGIPARNHVEIGPVPHHCMPYYLRLADVAVFPNRCEGGTNLVAMEAMACGIPTVQSRATGHLDIPTQCWAITGGTSKPVAPYRETTGWHEADPSSLANCLVERCQWASVGYYPAADMRRFTWDACAAQILSAL